MRLKYSVFLAFIAAIVGVSPVLATAYSAPYTITETSSNAYTMLPVSVDVGNQWLADNGFIEADALDTRVETFGGLEHPHMVVGDRTLAAVAVPADSQTNLYFTTGNSDLTAMYIIVGYDGYLTIPDAAGLELANNFEIELSGYIDTSSGSDKNLIYKQSAFRTYVSATGEITSAVSEETITPNQTENLLPDGDGDYTNISTLVGAATHWEAVDDPVASPDDSTTYVESIGSVQEKDAYTLGVTSIGTEDVINSVTVYFRISEDADGGYAQPYLRLSGTETTGTEITVVSSWTTYSEALARPGGGSWTVADLNALQVVIGLRNTTGGRNALCTQIYVVVNYDDYVYTEVSVTATAVSSGEHIVKTTADTTNLKIYIDDVEEDSVALSGVSVLDNANDWILNQNNVLPYMAFYKHTVSSSLITRFEPNIMIIGTTLPDREAASNDAIFTFGANPAGVAVVLGGMVSDAQPILGLVVEDETLDILPAVGVSDWFEEPDVGGTLLTNPLRPIATLMSDTTTITELQAWRLLALAFILFVTVSVLWAVRGHLLITGIAAGAAIGLAVAWTIFPIWALVFVVMAVVGGLVSERSPSL